MPEKTYVVTGAMSGIGTSVLGTLTSRGAANIVGLAREAHRRLAQPIAVDFPGAVVPASDDP